MTPDSPDKPDLKDNIQRTVERAALRNVRSLVDELQEGEARRRRLQRQALILGAVTVVGIVTFVIVNTKMKLRDEELQRQRLACEFAIWQGKVRQEEASLKALRPDLTPKELQANLIDVRKRAEEVARKECQK